MPIPLLVYGGVALASAIGKYVQAKKQQNEADRLRTQRPSFEINRELQDNARIAGERYTNYQMPGYSKLMADLEGSYSQSVADATQGATSSADVLDAVSKAQFGLGQQKAGLASMNAQGKERAQGDYLNAKAALGNEFKEKNEYDRSVIDQQLGESQQLNAAGTANAYSAADQAAKLVAAMYSYRGNAIPDSSKKGLKAGESLFDDYFKD